MGVKENVPVVQINLLPTPAVGAEFAFTAPGQGLWRVISLVFRLVTSAVVANRAVTLVADDGSNTFFRASAGVAQAASQTVDYGAFPGASESSVAMAAQEIPLPIQGLWLQPGWRLRSVTGAIDVGDQYSAVSALVEEYPTGPGAEWTPTTDRAVYLRS